MVGPAAGPIRLRADRMGVEQSGVRTADAVAQRVIVVIVLEERRFSRGHLYEVIGVALVVRPILIRIVVTHRISLVSGRLVVPYGDG